VDWPTVTQIEALAPLPDGYRYEKLCAADVPALIDGIRRWHPDIAVGGGSCYLRKAFYDASVCLGEETHKDVFVCVFKRAQELVGMWSWERIPDTRSMYGRLIVVAPEHRSAKLASQVMPLAVAAGRAMGAEFLFGLATLKIPHMQYALEKAGFQLVGFTSGYDCEEVAPGDVRRVFEGVYCKVLVPDDELVRPDPANLTPRARALFDLLFPQPNGAPAS
jgi:GNAT superfamily N-acetyltransferase